MVFASIFLFQYERTGSVIFRHFRKSLKIQFFPQVFAVPYVLGVVIVTSKTVLDSLKICNKIILCILYKKNICTHARYPKVTYLFNRWTVTIPSYLYTKNSAKSKLFYAPQAYIVYLSNSCGFSCCPWDAGIIWHIFPRERYFI